MKSITSPLNASYAYQERVSTCARNLSKKQDTNALTLSFFIMQKQCHQWWKHYMDVYLIFDKVF